MCCNVEGLLSKKEEVDALCSQIRFQKTVQGQPNHDSSVFNESKAGKDLLVEQLSRKKTLQLIPGKKNP